MAGYLDVIYIKVEEEEETSSGGDFRIKEEEGELATGSGASYIKVEEEEVASSGGDIRIKEEEGELVTGSAPIKEEGEAILPFEVGVSSSVDKHKKHVCLFCGELSTKVQRHILRKHHKEPRLEEVLRASPTVKSALKAIIKEGDFFHNLKCIETKEEQGIITVGKKVIGAELIPCCKCKGFYARNSIRKHYAACSIGDIPQTGTAVKGGDSILLKKTLPDMDERFVSLIVNRLKKDDVKDTIIGDELILKIGESKFDQKDLAGKDAISQEMRRLGRFLIYMRSHFQNPTLTLSDVIDPSKFDEVIKAIRVICQEVREDRRPEIHIPSFATSLSQSLSKCCDVIEGSAIKKSDTITRKKASDFRILLERDYKMRISGTARFSLREKRKEGSDILQSAEDVYRLIKHVKQEIIKLREELDNNPTNQAFSRLLNYALASVIIFNRRRSGEASRMTLSQYRGMKLWSAIQHNTEYLKSLTLVEKKIGAQMSFIQIIGKRDRSVPILVSDEDKRTLEKLMSLRDYYVDPSNPFFFARPGKGSLEPLRGNDAIRLAVSETQGLDNPEFLKSTNFRKLFSTMMQLMQLSESDLEQVTSHLGHNIDVHKDAAELAKVGAALVASEAGVQGRLRNTPLDSITLEEITADPSLFTGPVEEEEFIFEDEETDVAVPGPSNMTPPRPAQLKESIPHSSPASRESDLDWTPPPSKKNRWQPLPPPKQSKTSWTVEEVRAILDFFREYIPQQKVPGKVDCTRCIEENPALSRRKWKDVKCYLHNYYVKIRKKR